MKTSGNSILITGGASGIGLALTRRLVAEGNQALICGRDAAKLERARASVPEIDIFPCDISSEVDRTRLLAHVQQRHPRLNVLINNAAITTFADFTTHDDGLAAQIQMELAIDLLAPIQLTALLLPQLRTQPASAVVNVTSALAYAPMAIAPVYSAAKAALHSFSQSLRHQLRSSTTQVFEVLPPAVDTQMAREMEAKLRNPSKGKKLSPEDVANQTIDGLRRNALEIRMGQAKGLYWMSRFLPGKAHLLVNSQSP